MARCARCHTESALSAGEDLICAKCFEKEWAELKDKNQSTLIRFLETDIGAGFTILDTAVMAASEGHRDHARLAFGKVREAIESVRKLLVHVEDSQSRKSIQQSVDDLEKAANQHVA